MQRMEDAPLTLKMLLIEEKGSLEATPVSLGFLRGLTGRDVESGHRGSASRGGRK
jgi:hypothetical protein